ncbi:hypothetical protein ACFL06_01955 [Patescibacteria group bacterium]
MSFSIVHGPDIETEWYNFDALNIPAIFWLKNLVSSPFSVLYRLKNHPSSSFFSKTIFFLSGEAKKRSIFLLSISIFGFVKTKKIFFASATIFFSTSKVFSHG